MEKVYNFNNDVPCYLEKLSNGLQIYLIPNPKRASVTANIYVGIGGIHHGYYENGELIKIPTGAAHFLEHQMFNQQNGTDVFNFFDSHGAYANANTSYTRTKYYFNTAMHFKDNLQMLLDYVNEPYFKKKSVLKERKIIVEEYNMSIDRPDEVLFDKIMSNVFHNHPVKSKILGSKKDIKRTTDQDLYNIYHHFYTPNNTIIIIAGNFDVDETLKQIKAKYENQKPSNIKPITYDEPITVVKQKAFMKGNRKSSKFILIHKIPIGKKDFKLYQKLLALDIYYAALYGKTSDFMEMVKQTNLVRRFEYGLWLVDNQLLFYAEGETEKYLETIKKIQALIFGKKIKEDAFNRAKKVLIADAYPMVDSNDALVSRIYYFISEYGQIFDKVKTLQDLTYQDFNEIISQINHNNYSYVVEKPKNKV